MSKRRAKKKRRVAGVTRRRVPDEFDARAYFLSVPVESPKPPAPQEDFDPREYFLNGFGEG
jgi:hypothetical protein